MSETTGRGSETEFEQLHARTVRILNKMLEAAEVGMLSLGKDEEGRQIIGMPPPALLSQAIKFLKDNSIDRPAASGKRKDTLKEKMPDFDAIEKGNVVSINNRK
jgi:hypothetical protein